VDLPSSSDTYAMRPVRRLRYRPGFARIAQDGTELDVLLSSAWATTSEWSRTVRSIWETLVAAAGASMDLHDDDGRRSARRLYDECTRGDGHDRSA
jgi:hypothetical protein